MRSLMHHRTEGRTLLGRAQLNPAKRSEGRDNEKENENRRLNANHTI
jgi:hypothetical protein